MTRIHNVQQIVAILQSEVAERMSGARRGATTSRHDKRRRTGEPAGSASPMVKRLRGELAVIDEDDPQRDRRVFRLFLEFILASKFGDALLLDPAFFRLIDEVQRQIEDSPELASLVKSSVASLCRQVDAHDPIGGTDRAQEKPR